MLLQIECQAAGEIRPLINGGDWVLTVAVMCKLVPGTPAQVKFVCHAFVDGLNSA